MSCKANEYEVNHIEMIETKIFEGYTSNIGFLYTCNVLSIEV